jgi:nucleotide-binding universal stress UspA family protein
MEASEMVKHVLVAVGVDLSEGALAAGIARAREYGARLTVLHVVDSTPWWALAAAEHGCGDVLVAVDQHARAVEQHCNDAIERAALDTPAQTVTLPLQHMSIGRAIANAANELDADLIVIGAGQESSWCFWKRRISDTVARCTSRAVLIATTSEHARQERTRRQPAIMLTQADDRPASRGNQLQAGG